jgi:hypothetical protein
MSCRASLIYTLRKPFQMIVYRFKTSLSLYISVHDSDLAYKQRSRHPITPRCAADAENVKLGVTLTSHAVEASRPVQS